MRRTMSVLITLLLVQWLIASPVSAGARSCSGGVVALTFDDGPSPETEAILDALKLHNLRATFFLVGWNVQTYPQIVQRIVREGHHVGNHGYSHLDLTLLTAEEVDQELRSTNDIIEQVTGVRPRFVRPPYGNTSATVQAVIVANRLTEVIWSQDSWDWAGASPDEILNQLTLVPPGGTFVMHDQMPNTLAAIPGIYWYFNTYWRATPICAGRLERTTNVQPVLDWLGRFYFARAAPWPRQ